MGGGAGGIAQRLASAAAGLALTGLAIVAVVEWSRQGRAVQLRSAIGAGVVLVLWLGFLFREEGRARIASLASKASVDRGGED